MFVIERYNGVLHCFYPGSPVDNYLSAVRLDQGICSMDVIYVLSLNYFFIQVITTLPGGE